MPSRTPTDKPKANTLTLVPFLPVSPPMDSMHNFQPRQIVCLEHAGTYLYAEVIQVVVSRQLCWVRPLLLGALPSECSVNGSLPFTDVRSEADLLWSITLFRPAFDTEVIPLLTMLASSKNERNPVAAWQLNQFIYQVWQANKEELAPSS